MMNDTAFLRLTDLNRDAQLVGAGYRGFTDDNLFFGFKVDGYLFHTLKDLKWFFGVKNLRQLEEVADAANQKVEMEFWACEGKYTWHAYLWKGAFRVGTSADRLLLQTPSA